MPVIPALVRLRQEDGEFQASLSCRARIYLKENLIKILTQRLPVVCSFVYTALCSWPVPCVHPPQRDISDLKIENVRVRIRSGHF